MNLKNNTIFITGGSSGIGRALAIKFNQLGNKVLVCGRNKKNLESLKKQHPEIDTIICDLSIEKNIKDLVKKLRNYSELNILINNAGVLFIDNNIKSNKFLENSEKEIKTNLQAPILLTKLLLPQLLKNNSAIINVSSVVAYAPIKSAPIYSATKSAIHSFTKTLRYQLSDTTIKVFEIVPPAVDTNMTKHMNKSNKFRVLPVNYFIKKVIKALKKDKKEIRIGLSIIIYYLNRIFPWFLDKILSNS